jgi:chromate transporter
MRNPLSRRPTPHPEPRDAADVAADLAGTADQRVTADPDKAEAAAPARTVGFGAYLRYFLGLGTWGFGGPIASVGYMQRDLVERRGWLTEAEFLDGVALGQTMPGPLAAQVVMWVGYLRKGWAGALATAAAFIGPSFLLVLAVAIV